MKINRRWLTLGYILVPVIMCLFIIGLNMPRNRNPFNRLEYGAGTAPSPAAQANNTFPGEFEKQQAIWLQWPSATYNQGANTVNPAMVRIIKALAPYIRVNVMSNGIDEIMKIKDLLKAGGYSGTTVHYYVVGHLSIWTRDVGPIFVKNGKGQLCVVDFHFNNYSRDGSQYYINTENGVHREVARQFNLPLINTSLVSEGGAIESNGRGTLMLTESVALKRNPGMTRQQIENEYKRVLGVKKVIWLKNGLAEDDAITSGHINEFARFSDPHTILLAQVLPGDRYANQTSQASYLRLEENYNILKSATDQNGNPFKIIRIPMPPTLYQEAGSTGKVHVRSYLNYAATNGAVLMQTYWKAGRSNTLKTTEEQVKAQLQSAFPGRKIIGVDAESINLWGGGIHCITQHMPSY